MVINRAPENLDTSIRKEIERQELNLLGVVPVDEEVFRYDLEGEPIMNLPDESKAVERVNGLMSKVIFN